MKSFGPRPLPLCALICLAYLGPAHGQRFIAGTNLLAEDAEWEYLLYAPDDGMGVNLPVDPVTANVDFHTTWFTSAGYAGPPFEVPSPGPFAYGAIGGFTTATNLWGGRDADGDPATDDTQPPTGERFTAYLRTSFTPPIAVNAIRFTGIVDDGCIIYLDGVEVARLNIGAAPDTYTLLATASGNENTALTADVSTAIDLPAGVPVEIAVSLHNRGTDSSDLGLSMEVFELVEAPPMPPENDDFADANTTLVGGLPLTANGRTDDTLGFLGASLESGEPRHGNNGGHGSVWWSWTADVTGQVIISTDASDFNTLLGVYTGDAVNALTTIATANSARFLAGDARVEFRAEAGTTYHIAVDGFNDGDPATAPEFGDVEFTITANRSPFDPVAELLSPGSLWMYLLYVEDDPVDPGLVNQPMDPALVDSDFATTWQIDDATYDGPMFSGPSFALLGYGAINADPIVRDIWDGRSNGTADANDAPASGLRNAVYFRTTFTPTIEVPHLGFRGLVDDGAVIYIDGVEVARMNMDPNVPDRWSTPALGTVVDGSTENGPQIVYALDQNLPANRPVSIAVSVHNASATSSDLGFDLGVYSINPPTFGRSFTADAPFRVTFEASSENDTSGDGLGGPDDNLAWMETDDAAVVDEAAGNQAPPNPGKSILANGGSTSWRSEILDIREVDPATIVASLDVRAFENSTGFEAGDSFQAFIEGSASGEVFANVSAITSDLTGGTGVDDLLKALELPDLDYTGFQSAFNTIPPGTTMIRIAVESTNLSDSERIWFDNLVIETGIPPVAFFIDRIVAEGGGYRIFWTTRAGASEQLQFNPDLSETPGWTNAGGPMIGDGTERSVLDAPRAGERGYYRVVSTAAP